MVLEGDFPVCTGVLLLKATEVQRIVFVAGANVIDEEVVVGDQVTLIGMVPEPAGICDQFALVIDEDVIDGDDALVAVAGAGVGLKKLQAALVDLLHVPTGLGKEAVEAGLVTGLSELPVNGGDILAGGNEKTSEVLGEMPPLGLIRQKVVEVGKRIFDHLGELDNAAHDDLRTQRTAPQIAYELLPKWQRSLRFAKLQF